MAFEDSWFQESKEIIDKCNRKPGPKNVCKIETNNETKWEPEIVDTVKNTIKNILKSLRKKVPNETAKYQ